MSSLGPAAFSDPSDQVPAFDSLSSFHENHREMRVARGPAAGMADLDPSSVGIILGPNRDFSFFGRKNRRRKRVPLEIYTFMRLGDAAQGSQAEWGRHDSGARTDESLIGNSAPRGFELDEPVDGYASGKNKETGDQEKIFSHLLVPMIRSSFRSFYSNPNGNVNSPMLHASCLMPHRSPGSGRGRAPRSTMGVRAGAPSRARGPSSIRRPS